MALSLYTPEHGALRLAAADGQGAGSVYQVGLILNCKSSHHGWVFQHQKPLVKGDLQREVEFQCEQPNVEDGIRSYCAVPLIARGESVGVFIVLSSERNSFSSAHTKFLREVSDQLTLAVKFLMPACSKQSGAKLVCPRCIARLSLRPAKHNFRHFIPAYRQRSHSSAIHHEPARFVHGRGRSKTRSAENV